ncbi:MAG: SDR family oxidoreductase [bacterium]
MDRYLITGASRGIGRAIAVALANKNSEILIHGRDKKALDKTAQLVEKKDGKATKIISDLSNTEGIDHIVNEIGTKSIKALINNAGITLVKPFEEITLEEWNNILFINVTASFLLIQKLLPLLSKGTSILNILSTAARKGYTEWSAYCMSKYAMEGFTQCIRGELQPKGIRVINIYPGGTQTEIWKDVPGEWDFDSMLKPSVVADAVKFALDSPSDVLIDNLTIQNTAGDQ